VIEAEIRVFQQYSSTPAVRSPLRPRQSVRIDSRVACLEKALTDSTTPMAKFGHPFPLPSGKGVASADRSFSNFVVAASAEIKRRGCSPRAPFDHSPTWPLSKGHPRANAAASCGPGLADVAPAELLKKPPTTPAGERMAIKWLVEFDEGRILETSGWRLPTLLRSPLLAG
jgi:hypothetical protein